MSTSRSLITTIIRRDLRNQYSLRTSFRKFQSVRAVARAPPKRSASTTAQVAANTGQRFFNLFYGATLVLGTGLIYLYITDTRASIHRWLVIPILRYVYEDPELAHEAGNRSLKGLYMFGLHPRERGDPDAKGDLEVEVFGTRLRNPIATSAGIDKRAEIPDPLFAAGPAIVEIGGVTPQPQPGNIKPRVFRLTNQQALINRYGLNSEGAEAVANRLRTRVRHFAEQKGFGHGIDGETRVLDGEARVPPGSLQPGKLLAVNIAKNKDTPETDIEAVSNDYEFCAGRLAPYADIIVVNVSSPNTPGLRSLQNQESLTKILSKVVTAARSVQRVTKPAVMVKVSPDEDSDDQIGGICQAVWESDVDGIIIGNTTNHRPPALDHMSAYSPMEEQRLIEKGGFSGPHLFPKVVDMVKRYKKLLGDVPPPSRKSEPITQTEAPERKPGAVAALTEKTIKDIENPSQDLGPQGNAVTDSIQTESIPPYNISEKPDSEKQSLFQLPTSRFYDQSQGEQDKFRKTPDKNDESPKISDLAKSSKQPESGTALLSEQKDTPVTNKSPDLARRDAPKVIFATGGVTNGRQALELLNAGASVAMVYTGMIYGGIGTISRIKDEMREEMRKTSNAKREARANRARPRETPVSVDAKTGLQAA